MIEVWIIVLLALSYGGALWWVTQEELESNYPPRGPRPTLPRPALTHRSKSQPQPPQVAECQKEKHSAVSS